MKNIRKIVLAISFMAIGGLGSLKSVSAITCPSDSVRSGESVESLAECNVGRADKRDGEGEAVKIAKEVISTLVPLAGIIALVVVIAGGYMITMSMGDAGKVKRGKTAIMWGLGGMIVALMAYLIVSLILG